MVCVTVVAGVGEIDLLLHLLTNVAPFKEVCRCCRAIVTAAHVLLMKMSIGSI